MATIYKGPANGLAILSEGNGRISYDTITLRAADATRDAAIFVAPFTVYEANTVVVKHGTLYEPLTDVQMTGAELGDLELAVLVNRSVPGPAIALVKDTEVWGKNLVITQSPAVAGEEDVFKHLNFQHIVVR